MKHVDDFIDNHSSYRKDSYARWFFMLHRLPAVLQTDFSVWIEKYKLFCTYGGERYRVTGASRLGDIWLTKDFKQEVGYDIRVNVDLCVDWSDHE